MEMWKLKSAYLNTVVLGALQQWNCKLHKYCNELIKKKINNTI